MMINSSGHEEENIKTYIHLIMEEFDILNSFLENWCGIRLKW